MGDWEIEVQNPDGGVMTDAVKSPPGRSVAFNTGMVIFGWLDLHEKLGDERYLQAALRAGEWLERAQEADGAWQGENDYGGIPHTYCSRVDWALLRLAGASGEERFRTSPAATSTGFSPSSTRTAGSTGASSGKARSRAPTRSRTRCAGSSRARR